MQVDRIRKIVTISHKALILFEPTLKDDDLVPQLRDGLRFLLVLTLFFHCFVSCFSEGLHLFVFALQLVLQFAAACSKGLEFLGDIFQPFLGVFDGDRELIFVFFQGFIIFLQDLVFLPLFLLLSVPLCLLILIYFLTSFDLFLPISIAIDLLLELFCHSEKFLDFFVLFRDDVMIELLLYLHIFELLLLLVQMLSFLQDFHGQISDFLVFFLAFLQQRLVTFLQLAYLLCLRVRFLQFCVEVIIYLLKISLILCLVLHYLIFEFRDLQLQLLYFPIPRVYLFPVLILHLPVPTLSIIVLLSQSTQLYLQRALLFLDLFQLLLQLFTRDALLAGSHGFIWRVPIGVIVQTTVSIGVCLQIIHQLVVGLIQTINFFLQLQYFMLFQCIHLGDVGILLSVIIEDIIFFFQPLQQIFVFFVLVQDLLIQFCYLCLQVLDILLFFYYFYLETFDLCPQLVSFEFFLLEVMLHHSQLLFQCFIELYFLFLLQSQQIIIVELSTVIMPVRVIQVDRAALEIIGEVDRPRVQVCLKVFLFLIGEDFTVFLFIVAV